MSTCASRILGWVTRRYGSPFRQVQRHTRSRKKRSISRSSRSSQRRSDCRPATCSCRDRWTIGDLSLTRVRAAVRGTPQPAENSVTRRSLLSIGQRPIFGGGVTAGARVTVHVPYRRPFRRCQAYVSWKPNADTPLLRPLHGCRSSTRGIWAWREPLTLGLLHGIYFGIGLLYTPEPISPKEVRGDRSLSRAIVYHRKGGEVQIAGAAAACA